MYTTGVPKCSSNSSSSRHSMALADGSEKRLRSHCIDEVNFLVLKSDIDWNRVYRLLNFKL